MICHLILTVKLIVVGCNGYMEVPYIVLSTSCRDYFLTKKEKEKSA